MMRGVARMVKRAFTFRFVRHEAPIHRVEVEDLRRRIVAAVRLKLGAA
jgi:hypothetical protein